MMLALFLYLIGLLESINNIFSVFLLITLSFLLILCLAWLFTNDNYQQGSHKEITSIFKLLFSGKRIGIFLLVLVINCLIPGRNTMYMMLGSYYLDNSVIPPKILEILDLKLNDIIIQLKKEKSHDK